MNRAGGSTQTTSPNAFTRRSETTGRSPCPHWSAGGPVACKRPSIRIRSQWWSTEPARSRASTAALPIAAVAELWALASELHRKRFGAARASHDLDAALALVTEDFVLLDDDHEPLVQLVASQPFMPPKSAGGCGREAGSVGHHHLGQEDSPPAGTGSRPLSAVRGVAAAHLQRTCCRHLPSSSTSTRPWPASPTTFSQVEGISPGWSRPANPPNRWIRVKLRSEHG
jgi:hypothetical protein